MKKLLMLVLLTASVTAGACVKPAPQTYCINGILYYNTLHGIAPMVNVNGGWYLCK